MHKIFRKVKNANYLSSITNKFESVEFTNQLSCKWLLPDLNTEGMNLNLTCFIRKRDDSRIGNVLPS
jgi:hypothetical protein